MVVGVGFVWAALPWNSPTPAKTSLKRLTVCVPRTPSARRRRLPQWFSHTSDLSRSIHDTKEGVAGRRGPIPRTRVRTARHPESRSSEASLHLAQIRPVKIKLQDLDPFCPIELHVELVETCLTRSSFIICPGPPASNVAHFPMTLNFGGAAAAPPAAPEGDWTVPQDSHWFARIPDGLFDVLRHACKESARPWVPELLGFFVCNGTCA